MTSKETFVGRIRAALAAAGLEQGTTILFFSDRGGMHGSHGQFRKTAPWEESIRIPFIVCDGPSMYTCRHARPDTVINHVDIAPTTLGLCGIAVPEWMQGFDYSGLLLPEKEIADLPDSAYLQSVIPTGHHESVDRPWRGIVTRDGWKYICLEHQPWLLFNLNDDPYEQVNLVYNTQYEEQRERLHTRLLQWIADTGDEFPLSRH